MSQHSVGRDSARRLSARNPRRRQRVETDSISQQPRRKRSKVTSETFEAIAPAAGNDHLKDVTSNGHIETRSRRSATVSEATDFPLRLKKSQYRKPPRHDGAVIMTNDAHYTLRHLSTTPDIIRRISSGYDGSMLSSPPFALVVTREHAYIWDYASSTTATIPRTFDVPFKLKANEPVPLGRLITIGASAAVGLILVSRTTGEIIFWENIDTAESLSLFHDGSNGTKGSLGSLFSGENVSDLTDAEHAGIILTLTSGRIAQISLRDVQGRPKIQAQFLKTQQESGGGGLLGSFRGLVRGGLKRDVIGVRVRSQWSKGQMEVLAATSTAQIQVWDLAWSGQYSHKASIDFLDLLKNDIGAQDRSSSAQHTTLNVVAFDILPARSGEMEVALVGDKSSIDLVFLVKDAVTYSIVEVTLSRQTAFIERVTALNGLSACSDEGRPRLLLPKPGHTAVIAFSRKICVLSLIGSQSSGPEAQLLMEAHATPKLFQDVIHLQNNSNVYIQGADIDEYDERSKTSSAMFFIHGYGLARISIPEPAADSLRHVSITSRLEQAIYFGTDPHNILDFHQVDATVYSSGEIEEAALSASRDLLSSGSPHLSNSYTNLAEQISVRLQGCRALAAYLRRNFSPISKTLYWKLMTDAEKVQAGMELWVTYQAASDDTSQAHPAVVPAVIKVLKSRARVGRQPKGTELDEVRDWFTHEIGSLDQLVLQALSLVNNGYRDPKIKDFLKLLSETNETLFSIFRTVFSFRTEYAAVYGIDPGVMADGVLEEGWADLPEPWTATHELLNLFDKFIDITRNYTIEFFDSNTGTLGSHDDRYVTRIVGENVELITILCKCYRERIGWCSQHYSEKHRQYAPGLQDKFRRSRDHHLHGLIKIGQAGKGLEIAEKYKDMESLVRLVMSETAYLAESLADPDISRDERTIILVKMDELQAKVQRYFRAHGDGFANAFFESHLEGNRSFGLLEEESIFHEPLTRYLRSERSRGRLGWIHEMLNTKDLARAQSDLYSVAQAHENKLWSKKVEASLSKLAALALVEQGDFAASANKNMDELDRLPLMKPLEAILSIVQVQEAVYNHIHPTIENAVDHEAELQITTDVYAAKYREAYPALQQLLEVSLDDLLKHIALPPEQLIDVLTLMDSVPATNLDDPTDISEGEFHMALKVLLAAKGGMPDERWQQLNRLVWKRLFLQDDWDVINKTTLRSDSTVQELVKQTLLCRTIAIGLGDVLGPDSTICIPRAQECVGAGSLADDLRYRFPNCEIRDPIMRDNAKQDKRVKDFANKHNLQKWLDASVKLAKEVAEELAQARLEDGEVLNGVNGGTAGAMQHTNGSRDTGLLAGHDVNDSLEELINDAETGRRTTAATSVADEAGFVVESTETEPPTRSKRNLANGSHQRKKARESNATTNGKAKRDSTPARRSTRLLRSEANQAEGNIEMA